MRCQSEQKQTAYYAKNKAVTPNLQPFPTEFSPVKAFSTTVKRNSCVVPFTFR